MEDLNPQNLTKALMGGHKLVAMVRGPSLPPPTPPTLYMYVRMSKYVVCVCLSMNPCGIVGGSKVWSKCLIDFNIGSKHTRTLYHCMHAYVCA